MEVVPPDERGQVDLAALEELLERYRSRPLKIGAFTACSNVTGVRPPVHALARMMHRHGGYCFVDYAASAPYVDIDMHPSDPLEKLDAILLLAAQVPRWSRLAGGADFRLPAVPQPSAGPAGWRHGQLDQPWKQHSFVDGIEAREDGGTPGFLETIKAALAVQLKEAMGTSRIEERDHELLAVLLAELRTVPRLHILADHLESRLAIVSFYVEDMHYNLLVRLLNDRFGIQVRGGCSCAGTYGHYLLHVDPEPLLAHHGED